MFLAYPTPVYFSKRLSELYQSNIWLKLEIFNPTGSHKDRETRQIIQTCLVHNYKIVGCASSSNLGMSLAYFCWQAGLECHVWVSPQISLTVRLFLESFSAHIHEIDASLTDLYQISTAKLVQMGAYNANPNYCPPKLAGNALIGQEIEQQIATISTVICPINNGSIFLGLRQGLNVNTKLIGVYTYAKLAHSIAGFHRAEGQERIENLTKTKHNHLICVTEAELQQATRLLMQDGIIAEPASAAVVAVLPKLMLSPDDHICCIVTGSGLKTSKAVCTLLTKSRSK